MSWHAGARAAAQRLGPDPRYLRRVRWLSKARALRRSGAPVRHNLAYVLLDPEPDNFTYELANERGTGRLGRAGIGRDAAEVDEALAEARADRVLTDRLRAATARHWWWSKPAPPFGKRLGWYALARLLEPALIVETGVHDGLGLAAAAPCPGAQRAGGSGRTPGLLRGYLAAGGLAGADPRWELRIQSSRDGLLELLRRSDGVGLFIHDSLHTYEHERWELRTVAPHLAPGGVLISDNVHVTPALAECSQEFGLEYHEFVERPAGHFYSGGAIGAGRRGRDPRVRPERPDTP